MINKEQRESHISYILDDVIRNNYVKGDEVETRVKIDAYIDGLISVIGKKTAEEVRDYFYAHNFTELGILYKSALERPAPIFKRNKEMDKPELFSKISGDSREPVVIYSSSGQEFVYRVEKSFEFEKRYYTLLVDAETGKKRYFRYEFDEKEKEEKLIPVKDDKLVELFSFLGL